ncbi:Mannosyl-oligosaccharide alpha-1,2-mannosidase 1B [Termitomyces sp. J132]|nr:Mannosyl-oligosaccharide alpha-1,2-mannosidase 1B [Termitomyces sp. J132]
MFSMRSRALWALFSSSLVHGELATQNPNLSLPPGSYESRDAVVVMFKRSYESYRLVKYAWGHDDLLPLNNSMSLQHLGTPRLNLTVFKGFTDTRNGWGATIVDAMSTMYIMGLDDYFKEAVAHVSDIDFSQSKTDDTVSVFETTIRYLGGMLSAYELSGDSKLLEKSRHLADNLIHAWTGNNDIPWSHLDFTSNEPVVGTSNIAEAGTLTIEFGILSKYTQNPKYRNLAERAPAPLPGLPAQGIDPATGKAVGGYVTWGGGSDSYFEYLIKYPRLFDDAEDFFVDSWRLAVDSSIKTLLQISTSGKHAYLGDYDGETKRIKHVSSHLECFHGGNWILGGSILRNQTIVDIGLELVDECWNTYASTATGIGPETFAYVPEGGDYTGEEKPTAQQLEFNEQHGFYPTASHYVLRPEVLESNFYAWRNTGDPKFIARAATALKSFTDYLSSKEAYSGLWDVNNKNSKRINDMESFWFAEVLKYLYLTFDDPQRISLDEYVFNTEAHPFKLSPPKDHYGSSGFPTPTSSKPFRANQGNTPEISQVAVADMPSIKDIVQGGQDHVVQMILNQ